MDTEYRIEWAESGNSSHGHQIICESRSDDLIEENNDIDDDEEYLVGEEIIPSTEIITLSNSLDQIAAENLIYMAQDGSVAVMGDLIEEQVDQVDNADYNEQQYFECQVTEEVITDDWVQQQGEDRVEVPVDQLVGDSQNEEILVPLPTDEYTTSRPYPCDFCSRRFRKKTNLVNHMVAHKNDRPNICNLCGARYIRKVDLMNHLKLHARMPDTNLEYVDLQLREEKFKEIHEPNDLIMPPMRSSAKTSKQRKKANASTTATAAAQPKKSNKTATRRKTAANKVRYNDDIDGLLGAAEQHENYYEQAILPTRFSVTDASRPFVCQVCGVSFAREKALNSHFLMHGVDNALECDTCNEVFWSVESLQDHQNSQHADESSGSEYEPDKAAAAGSDDESDSKFGDFYCNICGMSFHRIDLLKRHTRTHSRFEPSRNDFHSNEKHCCSVCGSTFAEALDLLAHAEIHTRVITFKCTLCGETFIKEENIRQHITNAHSKELTESTCRLCGKHCKDERTLAKHGWDHSKEKNHSCTKCGKTFFNKARLKRHMQSHRNKSVACNTCGENFPDGRSLMNHRHSHTNVSGRQFPCRECGKTFGSRSSQQIHMRIHTGERPYGCRFCWKAFADGGTLRKHERIHTGEKPYACPVCPRAFNQRVVLREHIRSHHSAPDPSYENSMLPYYCTVCGNTFKTPGEIIQHLIEHSDANTVSKRQPTVGPRKYKRRRKLKPDELETLRKAENETQNSRTPSKRTSSRKRQQSEQEELLYSNDAFDDQPYCDSMQEEEDDEEEEEDENVMYTTRPSRTSGAGSSNDQQNFRSLNACIKTEPIHDSIDSVFDSMDDDLGDIAQAAIVSTNKKIPAKPPNKRQQRGTSTMHTATTAAAVASNVSTSSKDTQQMSRPRMIHTTKKKVVASKDGRGAKTKTLVTMRTANPVIEKSQLYSNKKSNRKQTNDKKQSSKSLTNGSIKAAKSNSSHTKHSAISQNHVLAELSKKSINYSPDVVNDLEEILRSPIKSSQELSQTDPLSCNENSQMLRINYTSNYYNAFVPVADTRPATRSSKRLSDRNKNPIDSPQKSSSSSGGNGSGKSVSQTSKSLDVYEKETQQLPTIVNIKQEKEVSFTMTDENNVYTCEMCSAVFSDRAQLLVHVPVHI